MLILLIWIWQLTTSIFYIFNHDLNLATDSILSSIHFTTCELSILLYIGSNHTSQLQSIQDRKLEVLTGWISGSHEHRRAVPGAEVTAVGDGPMLHWPQPASDGSFLPLGGRQRWGVLPGCWLQTPCPRGFEGPVRWRDKCKTDHTDSSS